MEKKRENRANFVVVNNMLPRVPAIMLCVVASTQTQSVPGSMIVSVLA